MLKYSYGINQVLLSPIEKKQLGDNFILKIESRETLQCNTGTYDSTSFIDRENFFLFVINEEFNEVYDGLNAIYFLDKKEKVISSHFLIKAKNKDVATFFESKEKKNTFK